MNILLDQGLPRSAAELLRKDGLDAVHTAEIGLAEADDASILNVARKEDRVVITLDADFHALLVLSQGHKPSVVRIRMEGLKAEALRSLILDVIERCRTELDAGAMVSIQENRIRIRRLPVEEPPQQDR